VLDSAGNIYSTTGFGAVKSPCYDGCGIVFELAAGGSGYEWTPVWHSNVATQRTKKQDRLMLM
jgi:hypothetical protein